MLFRHTLNCKIKSTNTIVLKQFLRYRFLIVLFFWCSAMTIGHRWGLFNEHFFMSVTMSFGAFIAGSTSEGGGAVAFPVMTIFAGISPPVARDFSMMIQSVGMSAAALTITTNSIIVEWRAIRFAMMGGCLGMFLGLEWLSPLLPPPVVKLFFVSLWLAFACVLVLRLKMPLQDAIQEKISNFSKLDILRLMCVGFIGGVITSLSGSGLDIVTFLLLVLFYNINEKVATPTSVVLMAGISIIGFAWRASPFTAPIATESWNYWWVCVPIVVVFAPLGATFIQKRSRHFIVMLLFISILVQFIGAQILVPESKELAGFSILTFASTLLFLWLLNRNLFKKYRSHSVQKSLLQE
ncbi:hypothetical protein AB835_11130 [Candidatus Endobugula sertula]|uniref:Probable membrane transporter protein n=1 Tax=Candidatus Endobugula sertula TaxID=62101 RepID=A0A1D2QN29_9GAMM|nr:hypothetical protein AB835_11130 [Candidatus Endobugula sertula]